MVENTIYAFGGLALGTYIGSKITNENIIPSYSSEYYDMIVNDYNNVIQSKITLWKPTVYKPISFTGLLWTLQSYAAPYYNSNDDTLFLNVLLEMNFDNIYMAVIPNVYDNHKTRYDNAINTIKANNKNLLMSYVIAGFEDVFPTFPTPPTIDEYIAKEKLYVSEYISKYNPDIIFVVDEVYTMNMRARVKWTEFDWVRIISEVSSYIKSISPTTRVGISFTVHDFDLYTYNQVKNLTTLDVIAFNIYGMKRILEESTDTLCSGDCIGKILKVEQSKGKITMILETWLSYLDDYTFYYGPRLLIDSEWMRFMTYYCQKNNISTFMPFFSCRYINEFDVADSIKIKDDLNNGKRTKLYYDFMNLIKEIRGI